jgi:hypothetical protein
MLHLQSPLCISFRAPRKKNCPSQFPLHSPYIEKDVPFPEPSLHIFNVPRKEAPSRFLSQSPTETDAPFPEPSSTYLLQSLVKEPPPLQVPYQGPDGEMFITWAYYTYLSKFPIKEPPCKFPSRPYRENAHHQGLLHITYKAQ